MELCLNCGHDPHPDKTCDYYVEEDGTNGDADGYVCDCDVFEPEVDD